MDVWFHKVFWYMLFLAYGIFAFAVYGVASVPVYAEESYVQDTQTEVPTEINTVEDTVPLSEDVNFDAPISITGEDVSSPDVVEIIPPEPVPDTDISLPVTPPIEESVVSDTSTEGDTPEEVPSSTSTETPLEDRASTTEKITEVQIPVPLPADESHILTADTYGPFALIEQPVFVLHAEQPFLKIREDIDGDTNEGSVIEDMLTTVDNVVDAVVEMVGEVIEIVVDATTAAATFVVDTVTQSEEPAEVREVPEVREENGEVPSIRAGESTEVTTTSTEEIAVATDTETESLDTFPVEVAVPDAPYTVRVLVDGQLCTHTSNLQSETTLEVTVAPPCMTPGTHQAHIEVEASDTIYVWEGEFVWGGEVIATQTLDTTRALALIVSPLSGAGLWLREIVNGDTLYTFLEVRTGALALPPIGMEGETILWVADAQNALIGFDLLSRTTFSQSLENRRVDTEIPLHEAWYTVHTDAQTVDLVPVPPEKIL